MKDRVKEGAVEVSKGELLLEDGCWASEEEDRREAVLRLCEHEEGEVRRANPLVEKMCVEV